MLVNPGADVAVPGVPHDLDVDVVPGANLAGTRPGVAGVDEQRLNAGHLGLGEIHDRHRRVPVLHVGAGDHQRQQQASVSVMRCRLRPLTLLPASYPLGPPCAVVFTDCESKIAADGSGLRRS